MSNWKRFLSVLVAVFMLLSMPITTGIARTYADGTEEPAETQELETPAACETEYLDPATLHVKKLGETEEAPDATDNAEESIDPNSIVRASVFLEGKSTLEKGFSTKDIANNRRANEFRRELKKQQDAMQGQIEKTIGHSLNVKWNLTLAANAISMEIPFKDIARIQKMKGVKSVVLENQYEAPRDAAENHPNTAFTSDRMVGATTAWNAGYTGYGTRIAIIDTGLDIDHQSVNADAFMHSIESLTQYDSSNSLLMTQISDQILNQLNAKTVKLSTLTAADTYISAKIPYAFNYIDGNTDVTHLNDTQGEHGSHVAGISAANKYLPKNSNNVYPVSADTVGAVGMAPDAQLLVMKVFGAGGGAYDSDYMVAIEDAIVLGCDVVNLSLGSSVQGWTFSGAYQEILNNLSDPSHNPNMVVSISAGNSYALDMLMDDAIAKTGLYIGDVNLHTGGSPGTFVNSLCVAAAQNTTTKGIPLQFNNSSAYTFYAESTVDENNQPYGNAEMTTLAQPAAYDYVYIDAIGNADDYQAVQDYLALQNPAGTLADKFVIINRGGISFAEKGNNAKAYNPKAVVVANNAEGVIHMALTGLSGVSFPMVSITLADALQIKADSASSHVTDSGIKFYTGTVVVLNEEKENRVNREDATITDFSSWGAPGSLLMKPEITAPGGDILSIWGTNKTSSGTAGGTDKYELMSGTSMAAPHITGLAAVVAQYLRENNGLKKGTANTLYNTELTNKYSIRAINQSLMMSTATPMIVKGRYLSILQQGAGLVNVNDAVTAKTVLMMDENHSYLTGKTGAAADGKVKVELGDDLENGTNGHTYSYEFNLYNLTGNGLEYAFDTVLFTQDYGTAYDGDHMLHTTTEAYTIDNTVQSNSHQMFVEAPTVNHDVNQDGVTDEQDAQAILDYLTGEKAYGDFGWETEDAYKAVADVDSDGTVTSHDAYALLAGLSSSSVATIPAHSKGRVVVRYTINPDDAFMAASDGKTFNERYPNGAYIEGFTRVWRNEGTEHILEHTIPILGFYGKWTDPSMFDAASYTDGLYHPYVEGQPITYKTSYTGNQDTNYMTMTVNGKFMKFSGNPYMVESAFPAERLAINSNTKINAVYYNLYRAASTTGFAVTKTHNNTTTVLASGTTGNDVSSIYYSPTGWQNTGTKSFTFNKTPAEYGSFTEGDTIRIGFYAIPEYNGMVQNDSYNAGNSGKLNKAGFNSLLESGKLGRGAYMGYDFTIDNTAPTIKTTTVSGQEVYDIAFDSQTNKLTVQVKDNLHVAYVAIMSLDGSEVFAEYSPEGTDTANTFFTHVFDLPTEAVNIAGGYVALFVADYAGNEAAASVQVNTSSNVNREVYELVTVDIANGFTGELTDGKEYLILNTNNVGLAKCLNYSVNTYGTSATLGIDGVLVKPAIDAAHKNYVELDSTSANCVWTAHQTSDGWRFSNDNWYLRANRTLQVASNPVELAIDKTNASRDFSWDNANNALKIVVYGDTYYMQFDSGAFKLSKTENSIYLFEKREMGFPVAPVTPTGLSITPTSLDLYKGNTANLAASITPITATATLDWDSSNASIASVADGVVTANSKGTARITATIHGTSISASCIVRVANVTKTLRGFVYDASGNAWFSYFDTSTLRTNPASPTIPWTKLDANNALTVPLINAYVHDNSTLYASTNDMMGTSYLYTVDPANYGLTRVDKTYIAPFGLAKGPNSLMFGDMAVFGYAYFLLAGTLTASDDGALMPYGVLDTSETAMGGAYIAGVCVESFSNTNQSYYVLDETGKIWKTSITKPSGVSELTDILVNILTYTFTEPELVVDTGIGTSFTDQSIYYDGDYIYWAHSDGVAAEMIIVDPNSGKVYHAGDFGENIWPVGGLHVQGGVAPASTGGEASTMGDTELPAGLKLPEKLDPVITREQLQTPEIMARMRAEAEKMSRKAAEQEASDEGAAPEGESGEGSRSHHRAVNKKGDFTNGVLTLSESEESTTNGMFTISGLNAAGLSYVKTVKGNTANLFVSIHENGNGTVTVAYAKKGTPTLTANDPIVDVQLKCVSSATVTVATTQRNESYNLTGSEEITLTGTGHAWSDKVTYTWTEVAGKNPGEADYYTVTATQVCTRDESHTKVTNGTVTMTTNGANNEWTYTAEFGNGIPNDTKVLKQQITITVTSSGDGTTSGPSMATVSGGGTYDIGTEVTLTASLVSGYTFVGWYQGSTQITTDMVYTFTASATANFVAVYNAASGNLFHLTVVGSIFMVPQFRDTEQHSRLDTDFEPNSQIVVEFTGPENFLYWINGANKVVSMEKRYQFYLTENTSLTAVYSTNTTNSALVVFLSEYNQVMSSAYYNTTDTITFPKGPAKLGNTFAGWEKTQDQIREEMETKNRIEVRPKYTSSGKMVTITMKFQTEDGTSIRADYSFEVNEGEPVSLNGINLGNNEFSYWKDANGEIFGYTRKINIRYMNDVTLIAVYNASVQNQVPIIRLTNAYAGLNGSFYNLSFISSRSLPEGYSIERVGFVYAIRSQFSDPTNPQESELTLDNSNVSYVSYDEFINVGTSILSIDTTFIDREYYVRAYVVFKHGNIIEPPLYTDMIVASYNQLVQ